MEWKRIFFHKQFIRFIIVLLLVNSGLFLQELLASNSIQNLLDKKEIRKTGLMQDTEKDIRDALLVVTDELSKKRLLIDLLSYDQIKNGNPEVYKEYGQSGELGLRSKNPEISDLYDNIKDNLIHSQLILEAEVLNEIQIQFNYIASYPEYLKQISEQAKRMNRVSIFNQTNSFSQLNIKKTVKDYSRLEEVSLSPGSDKAVTSVVQYKIIHYVLLVFLIGLVYQMLNERKLGLWVLIHTTARGRINLFLKRSGLILTSLGLMTLITYGSLFIISFFLYGGQGDLSRPVQSVELFKDITIKISVQEFIVIYVGTKIVFCFLLALFLWFVLSATNSRIFTMAFMGLFIGVEYIAYRFIPIQSNWNELKYLNIFYSINPTELLTNYRNIYIGKAIIGMLPMTYSFFLVAIIILWIGGLVTEERRYPIRLPHRSDAMIEKIQDKFHKLTEALSVYGVELYKILIMRKGVFILAGLLYLLYQGLEKDDLHYNSTDKFMNTFFIEMSGVPDEKVAEYMSNIEKELMDVEREYKEAIQLYSNRSISDNEYNNIIMKYHGYESQRQAFLLITEQLSYINRIKLEKGINAWLINPRGYEYLLAEKSYSTHRKLATIAIFSLIILLNGIFSEEKRSGAINLIRSAEKGRTYLFHRKILTSITITILVWIIVYGTELYNAHHFMGLSSLGAPIQSLPFLNTIPVSMSLRAFLIGLSLLRLLFLLSVSFILCFISLLAENDILPAILILLTPSLLYIIGISPLSHISLIVPIGFMEILLGTDTYAEFILSGILLLSGVKCLQATKRKWCNTTRVRSRI